jgi:hypothetical protein
VLRPGRFVWLRILTAAMVTVRDCKRRRSLRSCFRDRADVTHKLPAFWARVIFPRAVTWMSVPPASSREQKDLYER